MGFESTSVLNGNIKYFRWSNRLRCLTPADFPPSDHRKGCLIELNSIKLKMTENAYSTYLSCWIFD